MTLIDAGSGPTHPSGPAGPRPGGPSSPPPPPPPPPTKATGPTGPDPIGDPPPEPGPTKPNHLVDHAWRLEVWTRDSQLIAVAEVRDAGIWAMQYRGQPAFYVGGRDQAETACRELVAP